MARQKTTSGSRSRPILRKAFPRERLFKQLDRFQEGPVIWVSGPGGCGKTTLVSSFLQERGVASFWYQAEEADKDLAAFFYHLGAAFKAGFPKGKKTLPLLTPEYLQGIPTFARRFFKEAFAQLKPGMMLVLDNFQLLPEDSRVQEILRLAVNEIPPKNHLVLISRKGPSPDWIRLRANRELGLLTWEDLRLTLEEAVEIVRLRADREIPRKTVKFLHESVNGWAAGLMLMLESLRRGIDVEAFEETRREGIVAYFGNEIFEKSSPEMRAFLVQTALLPRMKVKMVETLTGVPDAGARLSALRQDNYFVEQRFEGEPVYQYHPLFREFLLSRAGNGLEPEILSQLTARAATLLEETGQLEEAGALLRQRGDWWGLVGLIMRNARGLLDQGRYGIMEEWLSALPEEILGGSPWLLFWAGACRLSYNPGPGRPFFEKAYALFIEQRELTGQVLACWGVVQSVISNVEDFQVLDPWLPVLEALGQHRREFASEEIELYYGLAMLGILVARKPDHPDIQAWADRVFSLAEASTNQRMKILALFKIINYGNYSGRFRQALAALDIIRRFRRSGETLPMVKVATPLVEAEYFLHVGWPEKCLDSVEECLKLGRASGILTMEMSVLIYGVLAALNLNDPVRIDRFIRVMESSLDRSRGFDRRCYQSAIFWKCLLLRDFEQALSMFAEIDRYMKLEQTIAILLGFGSIARVHLMHGLGRDREAAGFLREAYRYGRRNKGVNILSNALMAAATIAFDQGKEARGKACLRKAFVLGREGGFFGNWGTHPDDLARLCSKALEYGIEVEYAREFIRRYQLKPAGRSVPPEHWPWPLKVRTLGDFIIYRDGEVLRFPRKAQKRPLDLLQALIAAGKKGIREEDLADALWPDSDGDAAAQSLKITLHRLRTLVGQEEAVRVREGRVSLDEDFCWIDAWSFERLLDEAEGRDPGAAAPLLEKAVNLYKGFFLGREMEEPWLLAAGERLRSRFLRGVEKLGSLRSQNGDWGKARECYLKGLEVDGLAEEFCRGAMDCCRNLGLRAEGLSLYRRFEKRLKTELGIGPAVRTRVVRDSLMGEAG